MSAFAGLTLLLAAVGINRVVSYAVAHRPQEIGVCRAFGATGRGLPDGRHSIFSVTTGSMVAARRAGSQEAPSATKTSASATINSSCASCRRTSKR